MGEFPNLIDCCVTNAATVVPARMSANGNFSDASLERSGITSPKRLILGE